MSQLIYDYFPDLSDKQKEQFGLLYDLYKDWNSKINVISRKDLDQFYEHHVLHSLGIAKVVKFPAGSRIVDVGTGGGFPGIPLAIMFPECQFHLVDSIAKKINVVKDVANKIGLANVSAEQSRIEDLNLQYDFVVSRAVARMVSFYRWVKGQLKPGGEIYYLKGGDVVEEMEELKKPYNIIDLQGFFKEDFFETKKVVSVKV